MTNRPGNDARGLDHELRELLLSLRSREPRRRHGDVDRRERRTVGASTGTATEIPPRNIS